MYAKGDDREKGFYIPAEALYKWGDRLRHGFRGGGTGEQRVRVRLMRVERVAYIIMVEMGRA